MGTESSFQPQVDRLVLLVIGVRNEDRGEPVEGDLPVRLRVVDPRRIGRLSERLVVGPVAECPRRPAAQEERVHRGVGETGPEPPAEGGAEISYRPQLPPDPCLLQSFRVRVQLRAGIAAAERLENRLGRDHPALHRGMGALDLGHVQEARLAADEDPAREGEPRDRLEPALVDGAGAIGDPAPAGECGANRRVRLEALELLEGRQVRVRVVEPDHEPHCDLVVLEMVEERAAVSVGPERPAERMHHAARTVVGGIDLPQLLDSDPVGLAMAVPSEIETLHQRLAQRTAATLGEHRLARV